MLLFSVRRSSHLTLAKAVWRSVLLSPSDVAVDATCGNGHDLVELVSLAGRVIGMDVDPEAIEECRRRVEGVELYQQSHEYPPPVDDETTMNLVVFNLGYLPSSSQRRPTKAETTLRALDDWVLPKLAQGGCASLTVYPGHAEGRRESEALNSFARSLSDSNWRATEHVAVNHKPNAPYLLTIHKL